jgi:type II secretory pathway component PulF
MSIASALKAENMLLFDLTTLELMLAKGVNFKVVAKCLAESAMHPDSKIFFEKVAEAADDGKNQVTALTMKKVIKIDSTIEGEPKDFFWTNDIVQAFFSDSGSAPSISLRLKNLVEYYHYKHVLGEDRHVYNSDTIQEVVALKLIGLLISSGVAPKRALVIAAKDNKNKKLQEIMLSTAQSGDLIVKHAEFVNYFGKNITELLKVGEKHNILGEMFLQASVLQKIRADLSD